MSDKADPTDNNATDLDRSKRWYIYEPIPAVPGLFKCRGYNDTREQAEANLNAPPYLGRKPFLDGAVIVLGYRGDRPDEEVLQMTPEDYQEHKRDEAADRRYARAENGYRDA